jgi:hypothetical protein
MLDITVSDARWREPNIDPIRPVEVPANVELDDTQRAALAALTRTFHSAAAPLIVLEGPEGTGRRTSVAIAAGPCGGRVVALDLRPFHDDTGALDGALTELRRECRRRDAIPVVSDVGVLVSDDHAHTAAALGVLAAHIDSWVGPVVVTSSVRNLSLPGRRAPYWLRWNAPDAAVRRRLWNAALPAAGAGFERILDDLARRHPIGVGGIHRVVATARIVAAGESLTPEHLVESIRVELVEKFGKLATHMPVRHTWDDLVLAPALLDQLRPFVERVRQDLPAGVAALFSGPFGTGKSTVAGLMARELGLDLYRVEMAEVIGTWIGGTEKRLSRLFDVAEAANALLLVEEADDVLVQRIEWFDGVIVLTTNGERDLTPRLAATFQFRGPEVGERVSLWRSSLPASAPKSASLDFDGLAARYPHMTGANVQNAVLTAAFLAADEKSIITQAHLERGARCEYISMGRLIPGRS